MPGHLHGCHKASFSADFRTRMAMVLFRQPELQRQGQDEGHMIWGRILDSPGLQAIHRVHLLSSAVLDDVTMAMHSKGAASSVVVLADRLHGQQRTYIR